MEFLFNNLSVAEYPLRKSARLSIDAVDDLKEYLSMNPETLIIVGSLQDDFGKSYTEDNLEILKNLIEIKNLYFAINFINDFSGIHYLQGLKEYNNLNNEESELDFHNLDQIEKVFFYWDKKVKGLFSRHLLKHLRIHKYKTKNENLLEFSSLKSLKNLEIIQSNASSISGLEELPLLNEVSFAYNSKLEITHKQLGFVLDKVEYLSIENCKKIDIDFVKVFPNLRRLDIRSQGKIETIRPILEGLPKLEKLFIGAGTIIEESDNNYYRDYPNISEFFFQDTRNQTLKCADLGKEWKNN